MDGEGAQSIYQSHSLCKEAFQHPGGSAADALVPLARRQEEERAVRRVVGVSDDGDSSAYAALFVDLQRRERGTNNPPGSLNNPIELLLLTGLAAAKPRCKTLCLL